MAEKSSLGAGARSSRTQLSPSSPNGRASGTPDPIVPVSAPLHPLVLAISITALAGFLDAVGYAQLQHLYVSFMSGNSTQLGMSLGSAHRDHAADASLVIGSFVAGAFLGTMIADLCGRFLVPVMLACVGLLLLGAIGIAALGRPELALLLVALAMGSQNTLHQVIAGADIGRSFITGALFGFGQALARWIRRRGTIEKAGVNLMSWAAFVGGVTFGTVVFSAFGLVPALAGAAAAVLSLTMIICGRLFRASTPGSWSP